RDIAIQDAHTQALPPQGNGQQARDERFTNASLAAHDRYDLLDRAVRASRSHHQWHTTPNGCLLWSNRDRLAIDRGIEVLEQKCLFFWSEAMRSRAACYAFSRADGTRRAGQTVPVEDLNGLRMPGHHVVNNHL